MGNVLNASCLYFPMEDMEVNEFSEEKHLYFRAYQLYRGEVLEIMKRIMVDDSSEPGLVHPEMLYRAREEIAGAPDRNNFVTHRQVTRGL